MAGARDFACTIKFPAQMQFPCGTRGHTLSPPQRRFHHAGLSRRCGRHILGTGFVTNTNKEGTKTKISVANISAIPELRFSEGQILVIGHLHLEKIRGGLAAPSGLASCLYSFLGLPTEANRQLQDA